MLRLPRGLQFARRQYWLTCRPLIVRKPKLIQSRSVVQNPQTVNNWSVSTPPSIMNQFPTSTCGCEGEGTLDDGVTRSKDSDVQKIELPEVPRIPTKKRTFHLNHDELEALVRPLLSCHWHVGHVRDAVDNLKVLSLNKLFSFKDFRSAVEFFNALADIQEEDKHHARITVDYASVSVSIHTHVAYQRTSDTDAGTQPIKVPGLTVRDVRFTVKVERLHGKFLDDGRAVTKVPVDSASLEEWSMEQLRQRYPALCG